MIASLPWYPAARPMLDRLWRDIRARLGHGPATLRWPGDVATIAAPASIVLTQTCAPVWQRHLAGRLHIVGTFDFGVAAPGFYRSALVTRSHDVRSLGAAATRVAVNDFDSQSGWGALAHLAPGEVVLTGSHAASMALVASGGADLAAIDAVTWRLSPHPRLVVRALTDPTPSPPLLTGDPDLIAPLRAALAGAVAALPGEDRERSGLRGFVAADAASYASLPLPPPRAPLHSGGFCGVNGGSPAQGCP